MWPGCFCWGLTQYTSCTSFLMGRSISQKNPCVFLEDSGQTARVLGAVRRMVLRCSVLWGWEENLRASLCLRSTSYQTSYFSPLPAPLPSEVPGLWILNFLGHLQHEWSYLPLLWTYPSSLSGLLSQLSHALLFPASKMTSVVWWYPPSFAILSPEFFSLWFMHLLSF